MSVTNRWILKTDSNGVDPTGFSNMDAPTIMRKCSSLMGRAEQGACAANLDLAFAPVAAKATITLAGNCHNTYTLTICNTAITFKTSGAAGASNEINIGSAGDGTDVATSLAALINGTTNSRGFTTKSTSFLGVCTASASGAVVTLTAYLPGIMSNGLALSKTEADVTLTYSWGASVAGTEGTQKTYSLGL
jgi:hypothetical protein